MATQAAPQQQDPSPQTGVDKQQREDDRAQQKNNAELLERITSSAAITQRDDLILRRVEFDYKQRLAKMFANSGCFVDIDRDANGDFLPEEMSIARAVVKIELGASMGFSPAEAMTGIDIIKGRVAVGANLRAARMQRAGYGWPGMICRDDGCWIPLEFQGKPMLQQQVDDKGSPVVNDKGEPVLVQVLVSYTKADADRAGLSGKDNYKKDPSSMYYARAITRAQRRYGPGVLGVNVLDTYEAEDLEPMSEASKTALPPGTRLGTRADQEKVLDEKLEQKSKPKPKETDAERDQRNLDRIAKADEQAKAETKEPAKEEPKPTEQVPDDSQPADTSERQYANWQELDDQTAPELGLRIIVSGVTYIRQSVDQTWTRESGQRRPIPNYGKGR